MLHKPTVIGIIPARYGSTRFPGKPLVLIQGKSLIQHTYENARRCALLKKIVVATDDLRIFNHVLSFGGAAVMTSPNCPTGTDRIAEALQNDPSLSEGSIVINIQGDEPCFDPRIVDQLATLLIDDREAVMSTPIARIRSTEEAYDPSVVKCIIDKNGYALYFSRGLIPHGLKGKFQSDLSFYRHVGIYGYRREFILHYSQMSSTPLQLAEDLEQLKVLENGYKIKVTIVNDISVGVNTPEDIEKVERLLCNQSTFL